MVSAITRTISELVAHVRSDVIKIGNLNKRVTIQRRDVTRDVYGGERPVVWTDSATVWAEVKPLRGQRGDEFFASNQEKSRGQRLVTIRYRSDVTPEYRLEYKARGKTRYFNILDLNDVDEEGRFIEMLCEEDLT